jgi:hypothetical protein
MLRAPAPDRDPARVVHLRRLQNNGLGDDAKRAIQEAWGGRPPIQLML